MTLKLIVDNGQNSSFDEEYQKGFTFMQFKIAGLNSAERSLGELRGILQVLKVTIKLIEGRIKGIQRKRRQQLHVVK